MAKKLLTSLMLAVFLLASAGASHAAVWKTVTLTYVGINGTSPVIQCTDTAATPAFTNRNFLLSSSAANTMLATALSAMAAGKQVLVNLANTTEWSVVNTIYMSQN